MGFFDLTSTIQEVPKNLEKLFNDQGWSTFGKYRVWAPKSSDTYRKSFGEVAMFQSTGSDGEVRNFGFFYGYGGQTVTALGTEPTISKNSSLGLLGKGDGTKTVFKFLVFPVISSYTTVYVGGTKVTSGYTIDEEKGEITFTTAPQAGKEIRATYALTDNAPDVSARLWFFTFEDVREEYIVLASGFSDYSKLGSGDGANKAFTIPTGGRDIRTGTLTVYKNGAVAPATDYTIDYATKKITFNTAPTNGIAITADYVMVLTKDVNNYFGDFKVTDFNAYNPKALASAILTPMNFLYPSLPTAVSFIPDEKYGFAWPRDSQIYYWGNITIDRIVMFLRVDPAPNPEKTYFAPLYIGKLTTIGTPPRKNNVLIGGGRVQDEIAYSTDIKLGRYSVDYGPNTSNGNSTVQLQQSVGGAYYQKHYLAFITHDIQIDSTQESRFNPSVYSGKYHISPCYIVHPNDGFVGRLDEVYAVHPKNISQLDELEVVETSKDEDVGKGDGTKTVFHLYHTPKAGTLRISLNCVDTTAFTLDPVNKKITFATPPGKDVEILANYDYKQIYRYTLADTPNTPFTLANASPYAPIGIAMLKENIT